MVAADSGIAIIGMSGRFPGASGPVEFWQNLVAGRESLSRFTDAELAAAGVPAGQSSAPDYVPVRGVLADVELFDAEFFEFTPRDAVITDPQQRLLLTCAWEAFEDAGYDPARIPDDSGVFVGASESTYRYLIDAAEIDEMSIALGNEKHFLASRIAYKLNLHGPAVTVQTACSTSLVAVHLACQSLRVGETSLALAGGASIVVPQQTGYVYTPNGIQSPDGHCRAFDAHARGTIPGNGIGLVMLKRVEDALRDRDTIIAIIRGSAVNNDGARKMGFAAPSIVGQSRAIGKALAAAGVRPEDIDYVEAHGTGTALGDPVEVAALADVFGPAGGAGAHCGIGSVKPNIGHLDVAAGISGLIKSALAISNQQIPPTINYQDPNPEMALTGSPFYIVERLRPWPRRDRPRRCGVSSFGIGGTNAHVIVEESPARDCVPVPDPDRPEILPLSARDPAALRALARNLSAHLRNEPGLGLADVAYTLQVGRARFPYRQFVVSSAGDRVADQVAAVADAAPRTRISPQRTLTFLFPGQGAQYAGMAQTLYAEFPQFRSIVDYCAAALLPELGLDLLAVLRGPTAEDSSLLLRPTEIAQPGLFVVEYAAARLLEELGIRPAVLAGHSVGEYVAACLAGAFSLEEGLHLIAVRGRLMGAAAPGAMVSVQAQESRVREEIARSHLPVDIAAVNAASSVVLSGTVAAIQEITGRLEAAEIGIRQLSVSHAFHSRMMDPVLAEFRALARSIAFRPLRAPVILNVTGEIAPAGTMLDADYWADQLRSPVLFKKAVDQAAALPGAVLVEIGPGTVLSASARQQVSTATVVPPVLPDRRQAYPQKAALTALGALWAVGEEVDWVAVNDGRELYRVPLPSYPFQLQRFWPQDPRPHGPERHPGSPAPTLTVDAPAITSASAASEVEDPMEDLVRAEIETEVARIWQELFGIDAIDKESNFVDLGGDSLLAIQVTRLLGNRMGTTLSLEDIFRAGTIRELADKVLTDLLSQARGS